MKFQSTIALLALAIGVQAASVANVLSDISTVSTDVTNLNNAINAFSGSNLIAALAIHTDAGTLTSAVNKATTDSNALTPLPISESDGQSILNAVTAIKPTILSALTGIVAKKAALTALPVGGIPALVKSDLASLNTATSAFEAALIAKAPADLKSSASALQSSINAAFATAIAAYASA
ncbi:hypothetical protein D9619_011311 [Psilocybe cf. subviscida]|uniref:Hydrophobic surface binding protein n=1 Tax=Psilocybe cf. subviscida TaxID=2480587 RepID=A0A8H5BJ47_9AGAR|nr:hypothetical protein D9619_011311 [Psilocybe cf. subviscida]